MTDYLLDTHAFSKIVVIFQVSLEKEIKKNLERLGYGIN